MVLTCTYILVDSTSMYALINRYTSFVDYGIVLGAEGELIVPYCTNATDTLVVSRG